MKKIALSLLVGLCLLPGEASAEQLVTTFKFQMVIGGNVTPLSSPTPNGYHIVLPSGLSNFECIITEKFVSNDGGKYYHNIVCTDSVSSNVFGTSVACYAGRVSENENGLFLRKNTSIDVSLLGFCQTQKLKTSEVPKGTSL